MTPPTAPGYFWQPVRCMPHPLPAYTFIDTDGTLWVSVPAQQVVAAHVALFIAGMALVDAWRRGPGRAEVGELRQMTLWGRAA